MSGKLIICPRCRTRHIVSYDTEDFECTCNSGNNTLDNEDVVVIGDWEDYTGEGSERLPLMQGIANKLQGTDANIEEGANFDGVTKRGARASTHRRRQHIEFIDNV